MLDGRLVFHESVTKSYFREMGDSAYLTGDEAVAETKIGTKGRLLN